MSDDIDTEAIAPFNMNPFTELLARQWYEHDCDDVMRRGGAYPMVSWEQVKEKHPATYELYMSRMSLWVARAAPKLYYWRRFRPLDAEMVMWVDQLLNMLRDSPDTKAFLAENYGPLMWVIDHISEARFASKEQT